MTGREQETFLDQPRAGRAHLLRGSTKASALLIDATRGRDYAPTSLPTEEHMVGARKIWERLGLPELELRDPWYG